MKITVIKKAEGKKTAGASCPWIIEDMVTKQK
jgi:hypothetical protein